MPPVVPERPARPGSAIGRVGGSSGTFGCLARRSNEAGALFILTAGHVVLSAAAAAGDPVLQPGTDLGGSDPACRLGTLERWTPYEASAAGFPNHADAALVRVADPATVSPRIPAIGAPEGSQDVLEIGSTVQLYGRTSRYQRGIVVMLDYEAEFTIDLPGIGKRRVGFSNLVLCTKFTAGGDSGAAVLDMARRVVGIHLGGTDSGSFFCRIAEVRSALGIEIA